VKLDRAAEAEIARLLERDVEQAKVLELLSAAERADINRAQAAVDNDLRHLPLRVLVVARD
jgi:hypothetical protein